MSNEVNNLASSFVAMAQAFEKLPIVQAELEKAQKDNAAAYERIQTLELRLLDRANELDAAHAATRKMEVERDHAETMFLETDDKLAKAKDVLSALIGNASDFIRAVEPPKPEPMIEPETTEFRKAFDEPMVNVAPESTAGPTETVEAPLGDPTAAPSWATPISPSVAESSGAASGENVASSTMGESAVGEHVTSMNHTPASATIVSNTSEPAHSGSVEAQPEGSVQRDPTLTMESSSGNASNASAPLKPYEGKRYTDVPFYVSLVEWLNGGGTEEAYYAR